VTQQALFFVCVKYFSWWFEDTHLLFLDKKETEGMELKLNLIQTEKIERKKAQAKLVLMNVIIVNKREKSVWLKFQGISV
jgi:hypothetical protein